MGQVGRMLGRTGVSLVEDGSMLVSVWGIARAVCPHFPIMNKMCVDVHIVPARTYFSKHCIQFLGTRWKKNSRTFVLILGRSRRVGRIGVDMYVIGTSVHTRAESFDVKQFTHAVMYMRG